MTEFSQEHRCSLKTAAERARITLKEIETLTYSCSSTLDLIDLDKQLKSLRTELQSKLPQEEGIIIRPAVVARALKTKKKYAQLRQNKQNCSALTLSKKRGKRRADSKYRNRVGARAERLRKVHCKCIIIEL